MNFDETVWCVCMNHRPSSKLVCYFESKALCSFFMMPDFRPDFFRPDFLQKEIVGSSFRSHTIKISKRQTKTEKNCSRATEILPLHFVVLEEFVVDFSCLKLSACACCYIIFII